MPLNDVVMKTGLATQQGRAYGNAHSAFVERYMTRIPRLAKALALPFLLLGLAACGGGGHSHSHAPEAIISGHMTVTPGFARTPTAGAPATAAYFSLSSTVDDALVSVTTPDAETVELHTVSMAEGVMRMRPVEKIMLPAGETVALQPGGLHLMIMQPDDRLVDAEAIDLTLTFEDAEPIVLSLPLKGIGEEEEHDHHHDH